MERYLPTGSEQVSLPRVNEINAGVEDLTFLHMASRGLIDLRGGQLEPLMRPFVAQQGVEAELGGFEWSRLGYWYPRFAAVSYTHLDVYKRQAPRRSWSRGYTYTASATTAWAMPRPSPGCCSSSSWPARDFR